MRFNLDAEALTSGSSSHIFSESGVVADTPLSLFPRQIFIDGKVF
jgi:hypothetical protein